MRWFVFDLQASKVCVCFYHSFTQIHIQQLAKTLSVRNAHIYTYNN